MMQSNKLSTFKVIDDDVSWWRRIHKHNMLLLAFGVVNISWIHKKMFQAKNMETKARKKKTARQKQVRAGTS